MVFQNNNILTFSKQKSFFRLQFLMEIPYDEGPLITTTFIFKTLFYGSLIYHNVKFPSVDVHGMESKRLHLT